MYRELNQQKKRFFLRCYLICIIISIISLFLLLFYDNKVGFLGIYYVQALVGTLAYFIFFGWEGLLFILISIILLHYSRIRSSVYLGICGIIFISINLIYLPFGMFLSGLITSYEWMYSLGSGFYVGFIPITGFTIINIIMSKYRDPKAENNFEKKKKEKIELKEQRKKQKKELEVLRKKHERELEDRKAIKIKNIILECASKFERIKISEIKELIGIDVSTTSIINAINELNEKSEIQGQYFASSSSILFGRDSKVQEVSKSKDYSSPKILAKEKKHCIVCKGEIKQLFYECPNCNANYHLKCAIQLKDDNKACFSCSEPFPILPKLPEKSKSSDDKKDDPIVVSLQNISDELDGYLIPIEIKHKDHSTKFNQLKKNLQDELKHKISTEFFEEFSPEIEELFKQISNIDVEDLPALENIKDYQRQVFHEIIEGLKHLEGHCNNCGNRITELNQKICEYCGEPLN